MATAMDMDKQLPFRPFSLDTRTRIDGQNQNRCMDFLTTFFAGLKMHKYEQLLKHVTYTQLLDMDDVFWTAIEENIDRSEDTTISKPAESVKMKLNEISIQMKYRNEKLSEYREEVVDNINSIKVEKLDEILKYLVNISNYPTDESVADNICNILDNVLDTLQNPYARQIGYFFTICAVIFDIICGLNYVPFKEQYRMLNGMVQKLNDIAEQTGNVENIHGQGENEEEIKKSKEAKFKFVKYFYLPYTKGASQGKQARLNRVKANEILANVISTQSNDAAVAIVE